MGAKELILGGARSGKSRWAESRAQAAGGPVIYLATAEALDDEMTARIAHHRAQRPSHWHVIEEPVALAEALQRNDSLDGCLLVDCLTLWLSNLLSRERQIFSRERQALLATLPRLQAQVLLVSNEVGSGVVPLGAETRRFVDEAGRLHQELATLCDTVTMIHAGLPLHLKGGGH